MKITESTIAKARRIAAGAEASGWLYPDRTDHYPDLIRRNRQHFSNCLHDLQVMKAFALVQYAENIGQYGDRHLEFWALLDQREADCYEAAGQVRQTAKHLRDYGFIPAGERMNLGRGVRCE